MVIDANSYTSNSQKGEERPKGTLSMLLVFVTQTKK